MHIGMGLAKCLGFNGSATKPAIYASADAVVALGRVKSNGSFHPYWNWQAIAVAAAFVSHIGDGALMESI